MIEGKSIAWHYDACIEMWNDVAENGCQKEETKMCIKYDPKDECFMCEAFYNYDIHKRACFKCPFYTSSIYPPKRSFDDITCLYTDQPYYKWFKYEDRNSAIEIAQLFIDHYPGEEND